VFTAVPAKSILDRVPNICSFLVKVIQDATSHHRMKLAKSCNTWEDAWRALFLDQRNEQGHTCSLLYVIPIETVNACLELKFFSQL
jgi:hypothetical protein